MNYIFLSVLFFILSCGTRNAINTGYIKINNKFWDNRYNKYVEVNWSPSEEYFYLDSLVIYKRNMIMTKTDHLENTTVNLKLMYYCFANLKKGVYYEFDSLKIDAKCLSSYTERALDSGKSGINFPAKKMEESYPMVFDKAKLKDTIIDNVKYQMYFHSEKIVYKDMQGKQEMDKYETTFRWYLRNDIKVAPLRLNSNVDRKYNAVFVRYETQPELNTKDTFINESKRIEYYPQKLTTQDEKIILAWAKYADEHPVK